MCVLNVVMKVRMNYELNIEALKLDATAILNRRFVDAVFFLLYTTKYTTTFMPFVSRFAQHAPFN